MRLKIAALSQFTFLQNVQRKYATQNRIMNDEIQVKFAESIKHTLI
jgi:hypothetical protein